jgi:UDP-N-acetylglucosamine 2-epimerase (non-hydrolysing)/GDP/UDP-N,N'-diacetylbacillosamine 2-epimerase (hydrolysing)
MRKRKIAVITGSAADYGQLYWVIGTIHEEPALDLRLLVTGMHLASRFGNTVKAIEKDGFPISARVRIPLESDTKASIGRAIGEGVSGFARVYERCKPDIVVVLGDRFEIFAAAAAAIPFRIPIAHIHGGELSEGNFDEQFRHAITKMSHIHFTSTEAYRQRVIQMGEDPRRVFCYGAPGLDHIARMDFLSRNELFRELRIPQQKRVGAATFHPVTLEEDTASEEIRELLAGLEAAKDIYWVLTGANADPGGKVINRAIRRFVKKYPERGAFFASLGQRRYLSLLKYAALMVGNSSSGLIEAPSFELPVVNVGDRQRNRIRAANVIDVKECERKPIASAVRKALSPGFKRSLKGLKNPYGEGNASERIVEKLATIPLGEELIKRSFYDMPEFAGRIA